MTDRILASNFGVSTLAAGITNVALTLNLSAGTGVKFPSPAAGQYFMATLFDTAGNKEVIKVTARSTDQLTIERGQEGTAARAWLTGDGITESLTSGGFEVLLQLNDNEYVTAAGTGNAITLTPARALTAYVATKKIRFRVTAANTAAVTVNVSGLGARGLKRLNGADLGTGELYVGQIIEAYDNGSEYRITSDLVDRSDQYVTAAGTDTYTAAFVPAHTTLVSGKTYKVKFTNANLTAAPTLNPDTLGAVNIKLNGGLSPGRCDIRDNHLADLFYDGTNFILLNPSNVGLIELSPMSTARGGALACGGQAVSRATYASLYKYLNRTATVTISIANPGVVTWTAHGFNANDPVKFTTTGTLPNEIVAGTTYYVVGASIAADTFQLSTAPNGVSFNTTGSSTGTHTGIHSPHGDGDGSTTFNTPDLRGRVPMGLDNLGGNSANRVTGTWADALAGTDGAETHALTAAEIPNNVIVPNSVLGASGGDTQAGHAGSGSAHNNMQPSMALPFMIRY